MINVSDQFLEEVKKNSKVNIRAVVKFPLVEKEMTVHGGSFVAGATSFEDSVSSSGSFDIGSAIINSFSTTLRNDDGLFDGVDLNSAVFYPQIGKTLPDGATEWINKGVFNVDNSTKKGKAISIEALDNMSKFEIAYSKIGTTYPATLGQIVRDICLYCGVTLASGNFPMDDYVVNSKPDDTALTCVQMISYVAQIIGCFARCDINGRLEFSWYTETTIDEANHNISKFTSLNAKEYDVIITGIKVVDSGDENNEYMFGSEDYLLTVESNPLIEAGKSKEIAEHLGAKIVGMKFRPLDCSCLSDPTIEAGDSACVTDRNGNKYLCYINNVTYSIGTYTKVSCEAKSPSQNRAIPYSNETKAAVLARKEASKKIEIYDKSIQQLTSLITQSFGVFKTEEVLSDGSTVFYMHDKQTLDKSTKIWKMTADAFAVSSDGGKTWNAGLDADGNAAVNVLSAIGVSADWIQTGAFEVVDDDGNSIFRADKDTGQVSTTIETEKGTLKGVIANHNLNFVYEDVNGETISGIYFDFEEGVFKFDGSGNFTGSLNVADKFIVDVFGNARIYGGKYYAMDDDGNVSNFTSMDKDGFTVYSKDAKPVIKIGYPTQNVSYPYIRLYSSEGSNEQSALYKKFANGFWSGNDAPAEASGNFVARDGYVGMFYDFNDGKIYVVNGKDMQNVYTGESIARFG